MLLCKYVFILLGGLGEGEDLRFKWLLDRFVDGAEFSGIGWWGGHILWLWWWDLEFYWLWWWFVIFGFG